MALPTDPYIYDSSFPNFETPEEIGSFSIDIEREFVNSQRYLRYFVRPADPENVDFDLPDKKDTKRTIKAKRKELQLLHWIAEHPDALDSTQEHESRGDQDAGRKEAGARGGDDEVTGLQEEMKKLKVSSASREGRKVDVDFVCQRGLLTKIMCTPYEKQKDWTIGVTRYKDTYYLQEIQTEEQFKEEEAKLSKDEMSIWGWKFKEYLRSDTPDGVPNTAEYNNCETFYTVVKTRLRSHSLVISGDVDAKNVEDENNNYYMKFRTCKNQGNNFIRYKLKEWWSQSVTVGVKEIACGIRDDNGIVKKVKFYKTEDLPGMANGISNPWRPKVCFNFLDAFLTFIKSNIRTNDPRVVHILRWSPGNWSPRNPVRLEGTPLRDADSRIIKEWYTDVI